MDALKARWSEQGGYREIIKMAVPLILSTGATSILHFVDRIFLTWYSSVSIAAAMPAGILNFTLMSLFIGTTSYVSTFVAQYHGAKNPTRIGPSLWQGIYIAIAGGVIIFSISFASKPIFAFFGHEQTIQNEEALYFAILSKGALFPILAGAFAGFFSGRGKNWPIMWVNFIMTAINIILDYIFIFGKLGFPEMGIRGAAFATIIAGASSCTLYILLVFRRKYNAEFKTISGWRPDRKLLGRLIRFGLPSGVQFFIDISGFTVFILLVGRIGSAELAATGITFNINTLAFMPMMGFGVAITVLVGQFVGSENPEKAERTVYSGVHLCFIYMTTIALAYVLVPQIFLVAFSAKADPAQFEPVRNFIVVMLRFVAVYTMFDTSIIVFASALKGAGDTRFVMIMIVCLSIGGLAIPSYIAIAVLEVGVFAAWYIISGYIFLLAITFLLRFLSGKWKGMRVIEQPGDAKRVG
ncbi:MAG: MATE family efflux transporter [Spirochaetales bacterium]|nr:MATE family efflux transporter [Spirochaetales bacterium]